MNDIFMTSYLVISIIYSIFGLMFLVYDMEDFPNPLCSIPIVIISVLAGWLFFPVLLIYNVFFKKTLI